MSARDRSPSSRAAKPKAKASCSTKATAKSRAKAKAIETPRGERGANAYRLHDKERVRQTFKQLDRDRLGTLSFQDISDTLRTLNSGVSEHELKQLFGAIDTNKNGRIEVEEFLDYVWLGKNTAGPLADALLVLFDALDVNSNCHLPCGQICIAYETLLAAAASIDRTMEPLRNDLWGDGSLQAFQTWALDALSLSSALAEEVGAVSSEIQRFAKGIKPPLSPWCGAEADRHCLSEIIPDQLFLTGWRGAYNRDAVQAAGVTNVLSMGSEFDGEEPLADLGVKYLVVVIEDDEEQAGKMQEQLMHAVEFLNSSIQGGGRALVHCAAGISRSTTVVLAYLVVKRGFTLLEALTHTHQRRPVVWPNCGFMLVLIQLEEKIRHTPSTVRLSQYKLWSNYDPEQYAMAKVVDRGK